MLDKQPLTLASTADRYGALYARAYLGRAECARNISLYKEAERYLARAKKVCQYRLDRDHIVRAEVLTCEGHLLMMRCSFKEARGVISEAISIRLLNFGNSHPQLATSYMQLACVCIHDQDYVEANRLVETASEMRKEFYCESLGTQHHPGNGNSQYCLGKVCMLLEKFPEAIDHFKESQRIFGATLSKDHPVHVAPLLGLAEVYRLQGLIAPAEKCLSEALQIQNAYFATSDDRTHMYIGQTMQQLALCALYCGKIRRAKNFTEESLIIRKKTSPFPHHLCIVESKFVACDLSRQLGDYENAKKLLLECTKSLGVVLCNMNRYNKEQFGHSLVVSDYFVTLGTLCNDWGLYGTAKMLYSRAMGIKHRVLGPNHISCVKLMCDAAANIRCPGYYLSSSNTLADAFHMLDEFCPESVPKDHLLYISAMRLQALLHLDNRLFDDALKIIQESCLKKLLSNQNIMPPQQGKKDEAPVMTNNSILATIYFDLAEYYRGIQNYDEALKTLTKCIEMRKELFGNKSLAVAECWNAKAMILYEKNDIKQALKFLNEIVLPVYEVAFNGTMHPSVLHVKGNIALCENKLKSGSGNEALAEISRAFDIYKQTPFAADHPYVLAVGGFAEPASKGRLSASITEGAFELWAVPRFEGDDSYGEPVVVETVVEAPKKKKKKKHKAVVEVHEAGGPEEMETFLEDIWHDVWSQQEADEKDAHEKALLKAKLEQEQLAKAAEEKRLAEEARVAAEKAAAEKEEAKRKAKEEAQKKRAEEKLKKEEERAQKALEAKERAEKNAAEAAENRAKAQELKEIQDRLDKEEEERRAAAAAEQEEKDKTARLEAEELAEDERAMEDSNEEESVGYIAPVEEIEQDSAEAVGSSTMNVNIRIGGEENEPDEAGEDEESLDEEDMTPEQLQAKKALEAAFYLYNRGKELHEGEQYVKAIPILDECKYTRDLYLDHDHPKIIEVLLLIAENYSKLRRYEDALQYFQLCCDCTVSRYEYHSQQTSDIIFHIVKNFQNMGRYLDANDSLMEIVEIRIELYGDAHVLAADAFYHYSLNLCTLGRYQDAKYNADRAYAIYHKAFGNKKVETANAIFAKAEAITALGKLNEAKPLYEQSTAMRRNMLGSFSRELAISLKCSGRLLVKLGHIEEGQTFFRKALDILYHEAKEPDNDVDILELRQELAQLDCVLGFTVDALREMYKILLLRIKLLAPHHYHISDSYKAIGDVYSNLLGKYSLAQCLFDKVFDILNKSFDDHNNKIVEALVSQAELCKNMGQMDSARGHLDKAIEMVRNNLSKDHPLYYSTMIRLADWHVANFNNEDAATIYRRVIKAQKKLLGTDHIDVAFSLNSQAELYRKQGKWKQYLEASEESMSIRKLVLGETHWTVQECLCNKAMMILTKTFASLQSQVSRVPTAPAIQEVVDATPPVAEASTTDQQSGVDANVENAQEKENEDDLSDMSLSIHRGSGVAAVIDSEAPFEEGVENDMAVESNAEETKGEEPVAEPEPALDAEGNPISPEEPKIIAEHPEHGTLTMDEEGILRDCNNVPVFDDSGFVQAREILEGCIDVLLKDFKNLPILFKNFNEKLQMVEDVVNDLKPKPQLVAAVEPDPESLIGPATESVVEKKPEEEQNRTEDDFSVAECMPMVINMRGNCGIIKKIEAEELERFISRQSTADRKAIRRRMLVAEMKLKHEQDLLDEDIDAAVVDEPPPQNPEEFPGYELINAAMAWFEENKVEDSHPWYRKFNAYHIPAEKPPDELEIAQNVRLAGLEKQKLGLYNEAESLFEEAHGILTDCLGPILSLTHPHMGVILLSMANNSRIQGRFKVSKQWFLESMLIFRKQNGECDAGVADAQYGLGLLLFTQGYYDNAVSMHEQCLAIRSEIFHADHREVALAKCALADDMRCIGHYAAAKGYIGDAMQVSECTDADSVIIYLCECKLHLALGDIQSAMESNTKSMTLARKEYGLDHPVTSDVLQCQAECELLAADLGAAKKTINKVIKIRSKAYGRKKFNADNKKLKEADEGENSAGEEPEETDGLLEEIEEDVNATELLMSEILGADGTSAVAAADEATHTVLLNAMADAEKSPPFVYRGIPVFHHLLIAESLYTKATIMLTLGEWAEAKLLYDNAFVIRYSVINRTTTLSADSLFGKACHCRVSGELKTSLEYHNAVAQQRRQLLGEEHPDVADSLCACGEVEFIRGYLDDGYRHFNDSLRIRRKVYPNSSSEAGNNANKVIHYKISESLYGCAEVHRIRGEYDVAKGMYEQAYSMLKNTLGDGHLKMSNICYGMAENMCILGQYEMSMAMVETVMSIRTVILGDEHVDSAACLMLIAEVLRVQGKYLEAKKVLEQCMTIRRAKLGKTHCDTALTLLAVGLNFFDLAKHDAAKPVFERALFLLKLSFNEEFHWSIADAFTGAAENFKYLGDFEKAKSMHESALMMRRKIFHDRHNKTADSMYYLSILKIMTTSKFDDAIRGLEDSLAMRRSSLGQIHKDVAQSLHSIGFAYFSKGYLQDCRSWYDRADAMRRELFGSNHPDIAESMHTQALLSRKAGKLEQTAAMLERCLASKQDLLGAQHPFVADTLYHLAETHCAQGKYTLAKIQYADALGIRVSVFGKKNPTHYSIAESLFGLAECLRICGRYTLLPSKPESLIAYDDIVNMDQHALIEGSSASIVTAENALAAGPETVEERAPPSGPESSPPPSITLKQANELAEGSTSESVYSDDILAALPAYERALAYRVSCFGLDHPLVLDTQFAIAETYRAVGRYREARSMYEDILSKRRKVMGEDHPDTIVSLVGLAEMLRTLSIVYPEKPTSSNQYQQVGMVTDFYRDPTVGKAPHVTLEEQFGSIGYTSTIDFGESANAGTTQKSLDKLLEKTAPAATIKYRPGYMGYCFPEYKELQRKSTFGTTRPVKVLMNDALWLYDAAYDIMKRLYGEQTANNHPLTATILFGKSEVLKVRRDKVNAKIMLQAALGMRRSVLKSDHPEIADVLHVLAEGYRLDNEYVKALPLYQKALDIRRTAFSTYDGHPSIADTLNSIGLLYYAQGNYITAESLLRQSLAMREEIYGTGPGILHASLAQSLNNLASVLHAQGYMVEAEKMYRKGLDIKIVSFGDQHPDVALAMNNLALILKDVEKTHESKQIFEEALQIQRNYFVVDHPDIAATMNNYASLLYVMKNYNNAKDMYRKSLNMKREIMGYDHPSVASTMNNLAGLLLTLQEYDDAKDLYENSLAIRKRVYGEQHILVAESLNNIGLLLYMQGLYDDAYPLYEQSLSIKEFAYNNRDPAAENLERSDPTVDDSENTGSKITLHHHNVSLATSYHNLAILCHKIGKVKEAIKNYEKAVNIRKAFLGEQHPDTLVAEENMSKLLKNPNGEGLTSNVKVLPDGGATVMTNKSYRKGYRGEYDDLASNSESNLDGGGSFVTLGQESDISFNI